MTIPRNYWTSCLAALNGLNLLRDKGLNEGLNPVRLMERMLGGLPLTRAIWAMNRMVEPASQRSWTDAMGRRTQGG